MPIVHPKGASEPEFISRNNPVEGVDEAARHFFESAKARKAAREGRPPAEGDDPEVPVVDDAQPADELESESPLALRLKKTLEAEEGGDPEDRSGEPNADDPDPDDAEDPKLEADAGERVELTPDTVVSLADGTEITFHELQRGFQRQKDYTAKTTELSEQRRQFEEKVEEANKFYEQGISTNTALAEQLQAHLQATMPNRQEMERLRQVDPGEYAARVEDMRLKQAAIQQAIQARQIAEKEAAKRFDEARAARIPLERKALAEAIPAFQKNFDREYRDLGRYAVAPDGGGLRPEEWDLVDDHRHITLVWKAREYDLATRKTEPAVRKTMATKPRTVRSGASRGAGDTQRDEVAAAMAHLKANPDSREAQAAVFYARERAKNARRSAARRRV